MDDALLAISDIEFRDISKLVYDRFGIFLTDQKRTLVVGRLSKRIRSLGLSSIAEYLTYMEADRSGREYVELINRITTNHSYFYREKEHFEFLRETVLPEIRTRHSRDQSTNFRVWSAGCSSGEEPYTTAIAVREELGTLANVIDWGILATDLSAAILQEASSGVYPEARVKELPKAWLHGYFDLREGQNWAVREELRRAVLFKRLNLMNDRYPFHGKFDVVFCRNVMIYFDAPVRRALVDRIYRYVKPGGYLFVGHSESLPRETCPFAYVKPAVYQKQETE